MLKLPPAGCTRIIRSGSFQTRRQRASATAPRMGSSVPFGAATPRPSNSASLHWSHHGRPRLAFPEARRLGAVRQRPLLGHEAAGERLDLARRPDDGGGRRLVRLPVARHRGGQLRLQRHPGPPDRRPAARARGLVRSERRLARPASGRRRAPADRRPGAAPSVAARPGERLSSGDDLLSDHHPVLRRRSHQQLLLPRPHQVRRCRPAGRPALAR